MRWHPARPTGPSPPTGLSLVPRDGGRPLPQPRGRGGESTGRGSMTGSYCARRGPPSPRLAPPPQTTWGRGETAIGASAGVALARQPPSPGPSPPFRGERGEFDRVSKRVALRRRGAPPPAPPRSFTRGEGRIRARFGGVASASPLPHAVLWGRGRRGGEPADAARRFESPDARPPPLPRSWGRGRRPSRGTSERRGGGEGPRGNAPGPAVPLFRWRPPMTDTTTGTAEISVRADAGLAAASRDAAAGLRAPGERNPAAYGFLAPALVLIFIFFFLPVVAALVLSFTDFDIYAVGDLSNARWVGLRNYAQLLTTPLFWQALRNTFYFALVGGPLSIGVSLAAALLLNNRLVRFKGLFRTIYFAPFVTTLVAVAIVWRYLYHTRYGLLNYGLGALGMEPVDWLGDPRWAMPAIILMTVWKSFRLQHAHLHRRAAGDSGGAVRGGAHRRGQRVAALSPRHAAGAGAHAGVRDRHHHDRLLSALRGAVRDDDGRPAALHDLRGAADVRGGLPLVADGARGGGGLHPLRRHPGGDAAPAGAAEARGGPREPARREVRHLRAAGAGRGADADPHAVDGQRVADAGGAGEHLSAAPAPARGDLRALRVAVHPAGPGPLADEQRHHRGHGDGDQHRHQLHGGLRVRQAALPRPRPPVPRAGGGAGDPRAGVDAAALPADEAAGAHQQLLGGDHPGAGEHLRHLPHPPVRAVHPRRPAGRGADGRRRRVPHLHLHRAADHRPDPGDDGDLDVPEHLERLHVAAHRAERRAAVHAAGGAGQPGAASTCRTRS